MAPTGANSAAILSVYEIQTCEESHRWSPRARNKRPSQTGKRTMSYRVPRAPKLAAGETVPSMEAVLAPAGRLIRMRPAPPPPPPPSKSSAIELPCPLPPWGAAPAPPSPPLPRLVSWETPPAARVSESCPSSPLDGAFSVVVVVLPPPPLAKIPAPAATTTEGASSRTAPPAPPPAPAKQLPLPPAQNTRAACPDAPAPLTATWPVAGIVINRLLTS